MGAQSLVGLGDKSSAQLRDAEPATTSASAIHAHKKDAVVFFNCPIGQAIFYTLLHLLLHSAGLIGLGYMGILDYTHIRRNLWAYGVPNVNENKARA